MKLKNHYNPDGKKVQFVYDFGLLWDKEYDMNSLMLGIYFHRIEKIYCIGLQLLFCDLQLWIRTK